LNVLLPLCFHDRASRVGQPGTNTLTEDEARRSNAGPLRSALRADVDAVFALRRRVLISPGAVVHIAFWTIVASSREALRDLIDKHRDTTALERAATLAWTQAQVQLHHLGINPGQASTFQRLARPPSRRWSARSKANCFIRKYSRGGAFFSSLGGNIAGRGPPLWPIVPGLKIASDKRAKPYQPRP
jgi:hypothetical protein